MAFLQLPVTSDNPNYSFKTELDGDTFLFRVRFNTRANTWFMDICTEDEINLLTGLPLLPGIVLNRGFTDSRLPKGRLFLLNTINENLPCERTDLGVNCFLMYEEEV